MYKHLLIIIIVGLLGFTGWYVYHSAKTADRIYYLASNLKQAIKIVKKGTITTSATVPVTTATYDHGTPVPADSQARAKAADYYCPSWDPQPGRMMPDICSPLDAPMR